MPTIPLLLELLMIDVPPNNPNDLSDDPSDSSDDLDVSWLESLLGSSMQRGSLLGDRDRVRQILNSISTRRWLKEQVCQGTDRRRAALVRQFVVELMQSSGMIWRGGNPPPDPAVYQEALAQTWEWFWQNFCLRYDPNSGSFTTWFNSKLKFVIIDVLKQVGINLSLDNELIERVVGGEHDDLTLILINDLLSLVQSDTEGRLRRCRMQNYQYITCQRLMTLILESLRHLPQIPWNQLAQDLSVNKDKLLQFYRSTCRPCFRKLIKDDDWL
jgi:hypothetical protein